jgi:hypothetical protein
VASPTHPHITHWNSTELTKLGLLPWNESTMDHPAPSPMMIDTGTGHDENDHDDDEQENDDEMFNMILSPEMELVEGTGNSKTSFTSPCLYISFVFL